MQTTNLGDELQHGNGIELGKLRYATRKRRLLQTIENNSVLDVGVIVLIKWFCTKCYIARVGSRGKYGWCGEQRQE